MPGNQPVQLEQIDRAGAAASVLAASERSTKFFFVLLCIYIVILLLPGLGKRDLSGSSEPRVSGIAAEMQVTGNWIVPRINGRPFLEKPPLYFWATTTAYELLGRSTFSARLPSALCAAAGIITVFLLAIRMGFSSFTGFLTGIMLATTMLYWSAGQTAEVDMMLCAGVTLAMAAFYRMNTGNNKLSMSWLLLFAMALGLGLLSKGLVAIAIPVTALSAWLVARMVLLRYPFTLQPWVALGGGILLALIPVGIWLRLLYGAEGMSAVWTLVWTNNFGRFAGSHPEHIEGFFYYIKRIPDMFQPWLIFLPFALVVHGKLATQKNSADRSLFLLIWLMFPFLLLNLSAAKRSVYLLPLYPGVMLLIGSAVGLALEGKIRGLAWLGIAKGLYIAAVLYLLIAIIAPPAFFWVAVQNGASPANSAIFLIASLLIAGWTGRCLIRRRWLSYVFGMAAAFLVLLLTYGMSISPVIEQEKTYSAMFRYLAHEQREGRRMILYQPVERIEGATYYYLGNSLPVINEPVALWRYIEADPTTLVLLSEANMQHQTRLESVSKFTAGGRQLVLARLKDGEN